MKISKLMIGAMALTLSLSTIARPAEKFVLKFYDQQMRGQNVIKLKQELKRQHSISPREFKIQKAVLVAKSKNGNGKAKLVVGHQQTFEQIVDGRPYDFHDSHRSTFSRSTFFSPSFDSQGNWQIHTRGNFKVRKVVVFLQEKRMRRPDRPTRPDRPNRPHPRPHVKVEQVAKFKVDKVIDTHRNISIHKTYAKQISLSAESATVDVISAVVFYANGQRERALELEGRLREGRTKTFEIFGRRGRAVKSIEIKATSIDLIGSRGKIAVKVGSLQ